MSLSGKIAIVTGAGQGLGRAIALELAAHGALVEIAERNRVTGDETARLIRDAGKAARVHVTDVTSAGGLSGVAVPPPKRPIR